MVPKIINYCWFGGSKLPESVKSNIKSWRKYCPDYEIKRWDETNYDINKNKYVHAAYCSKKFAFLTDYVRLDVIYNHGGVYLDTDVELLKSLDKICARGPFMAFEQAGRINTGIGFAAEPGNAFIEENKEYYENRDFTNKKNQFVPEICVKITTELLIKHGLIYKNNSTQIVDDINIYPTEFFSPILMGTNKLKLTTNTYGIHHYESSWYSGSQFRKKLNYHLIPIKQFIKYNILDKKLYE